MRNNKDSKILCQFSPYFFKAKKASWDSIIREPNSFSSGDNARQPRLTGTEIRIWNSVRIIVTIFLSFFLLSLPHVLPSAPVSSLPALLSFSVPFLFSASFPFLPLFLPIYLCLLNSYKKLHWMVLQQYWTMILNVSNILFNDPIKSTTPLPPISQDSSTETGGRLKVPVDINFSPKVIHHR